jgi:hypothetical protein
MKRFFILISLFVFLPLNNVFACPKWQVDILDFITKEVKQFRPDEVSPLEIRLQKLSEGIDVFCSLTKYKERMLDNLRKESRVGVLCIYPNGQVIDTFAVTLLNIMTGSYELVVPLDLRFTSTKQPKPDMGYSMRITCQP